MANQPLKTAEEVLQAMNGLPFLEQVQLLHLLRQRAPAPILNSLRMTDQLLRDCFEREVERCNGPRGQAERAAWRSQALHVLRTELRMSPADAYLHMLNEYDDLMRKGSTFIARKSLERAYRDWLKRRPPVPKAK